MRSTAGSAHVGQHAVGGRRVLVATREPRRAHDIAAVTGFALGDVRWCRPSDVARTARAGAVRVVVIELDDLSGLDMVTSVRRKTDAVVIGLLARDARLDPLDVVQHGADDFAFEPAAPRTIAAKIRAWTRRTVGRASIVPAASPERHGSFELDLCARELRVRGELVPLPPREFDVLEFLVERPGRAFSRTELLERVWGAAEHGIGPATVTEHVRRLRNRIEKDPARPRFIRTVRGVGYRFDPDGE